MHLCLLGGLLGLVTPQLGLRGGLNGPLGAADGRDTLNGGAAEVGTVARLGSLVGNSLVGPIGTFMSVIITLSTLRVGRAN
jgi:hypothetical protein